MYFINTNFESDDRYDLAKLMLFENGDVFNILTSHFIIELKDLPLSGERTLTHDGRPDLLSYDIYGDVKYWWILMLYNDIIEESDLVVGIKISYPSLTEIERLFFSLKAKETAKRRGT